MWVPMEVTGHGDQGGTRISMYWKEGLSSDEAKGSALYLFQVVCQIHNACTMSIGVQVLGTRRMKGMYALYSHHKKGWLEVRWTIEC